LPNVRILPCRLTAIERGIMACDHEAGGLNMNLGLKGRSAIVTGASRGIGKAIAHVLAEEGVSVALHRATGSASRMAPRRSRADTVSRL
jgi:5,10-methylene-tetrahydrofolate dehydrogenase/methenyl tetrahydrofolate cyclohydrolase